MLRFSVFALGTIAIGAGLAWAQPFELAADIPARISGMDVICTGAGQGARADSRWAQYPLQIEIAGAGGRYRDDVVLTLIRNGATLASVRCSAPLLLFRVPAGRYEAEARTAGQTARSAAIVPASGQKRIILRFAEPAGQGPVSSKQSYPMNYSEEVAHALGIGSGRLALSQQNGSGRPQAYLGVDHGRASITVRLPLDGK